MKPINIMTDIMSELDTFNYEISNLDKSLAVFVNDKQSETELLQKFVRLTAKYPCNPLILSRFLEFLQLSESEELFSMYSLEDIETVYSKLTDLFKDDLDINIEYYYYILNVIDDEDKALNIINNFKERVSKKISMIR